MRKIYITIEINNLDVAFDYLTNVERIGISIAYTKYHFDILKDKEEKRLDYLAEELAAMRGDVLVDYACYRLEEIIYLKKGLDKYNLGIDTIFIPSIERMEIKKIEDKNNLILHGHWVGYSMRDVDNTFDSLKKLFAEIKGYFLGSAIQVIEV